MTDNVSKIQNLISVLNAYQRSEEETRGTTIPGKTFHDVRRLLPDEACRTLYVVEKIKKAQELQMEFKPAMVKFVTLGELESFRWQDDENLFNDLSNCRVVFDHHVLYILFMRIKEALSKARQNNEKLKRVQKIMEMS